jgi:hypothetical protein
VVATAAPAAAAAVVVMTAMAEVEVVIPTGMFDILIAFIPVCDLQFYAGLSTGSFQLQSFLTNPSISGC